MPILSAFPDGGGTGGNGVTLSAVTNITTLVASGKVYVKWTDPEDAIANGDTLATWGGTLLVRKAGSMPVSRRDGRVVLDNKTRNAYQDNYFCDSGLTDGETYYYKFFPYTTDGAYTNLPENEFAATPTAQVAGIDDWVVTNMSASAEAGDGKMTVRWTDPAVNITANGITLATWGSTTVVVKEGSYATDKDDAEAAYTLKVDTYNQYSTNGLTVMGLTNGVTYYISFFPETTDGGINAATSQRTTGVANRITINTAPSQNGTLTYDGNSHSPAWNNYDATQMTFGGTTIGLNAGSYTATFTPTNDYRWSDGSTTAKNVTWTIAKADGSLTLSKSSITLNSDTKSDTFTVTRSGDGEITVESSDTTVVTVSISGTTVTVSSVNDQTGVATITVKVAEGTNYNAAADEAISVSAEFLPAVGIALNDCSWDDISKISASGKAANYFAVGDRKAVHISGTIGTLAVDKTYYVYIIGIDHNSSMEGTGIQFGTFKTALSGGADSCLTDSHRVKYSYDGTKYFQMNHWGSSSNYNTSYGGWSACDMRYDILGSTNVAPSPYGSVKTTAATGSNPTDTCTTTPVANTLMAALPADLRAVMKPITKYTDNNGNKSNVAENVTATIDYLPLLSEFEVHGITKYANQYEKNYQAQYAYYSSGNSKVKCANGVASDTTAWRLRSPYCTSFYNFCNVGSEGSVSGATAAYSYGVSPVFMV